MRKIYISFLGLGDYQPTLYHIENVNASKNYDYVQSAEMDIILKDKPYQFDKFFIIMTSKSKAKHFDKLKSELSQLGVTDITPVELLEENEKDGSALGASFQWGWFETILSLIENGDELTIDLTHGYRIFSIVFSTAINFLQKSRDIKLKHVWYGAFERKKDNPPIIDMKDFFIINEWADAVSRLVEDADAKRLGEVAGTENILDFQVGNLGDEQLVMAFKNLTDAVRNVDIHHIGEKTAKALALIEKKEARATTTGKILLGLVKNKFTSLATGVPASGKYDLAYFQLQLEIIKILIKHKLFMQAYTVMREFIVSIGLIHINILTGNKNGRRKRLKYDVFINLFQFDEDDWKFPVQSQNDAVNELRPFYDKLKQIGVEQILRSFCTLLLKYRNGFDHAWTAFSKASEDIEKNANTFSSQLEQVIDILKKEDLLI